MKSLPSAALGPRAMLVGSTWLRAALFCLALVPSIASAGPPAEEVKKIAVEKETSPTLAAARAVWYDGRGAIYVAAPGLLSWQRGDAGWSVARTELGEPLGVAGWIGGDRLLIAVVDAQGLVLRKSGDVLEQRRLELQDGEVVVDVAVTGAGDVAIITSAALWIWSDERLERNVWPPEGRIDALAAAGSPGRQLFAVGRDGVAVRWQGRKGSRLVTSGAGASFSTVDWRAAWYSSDTGTLWVRAGEDGLLAISTEGAGAVETIRIPRLSKASAAATTKVHIDGSVGLAGDEVVFTMGHALFIMRERKIRWITDFDSDVDGIAFARDTEQVLVVRDNALEKVDSSAVRESLSEADTAPLNPRERDRLRHARWRQRILSKSNPNARLLIPSMHVAVGGHGHLGVARGAFALDAGVGLQIAPNRPRLEPTLWLWPRLDYVFDAHPTRGYHGATAGLGVGFGTDLVAGYYTPRAWVGAGRDGAFGGYRHALGVHAAWGVVGLEVMHGVRTSPDGAQQEVGGMFTLNIAPLIWLGLVLGRDQ